MIELETYGKSKPPEVEKLRKIILAVLGRKVNGELPFIRLTDLRQRVCRRVKAPCFYAFLKEMQKDELLMVSGEDYTWAQTAIWDHPLMVQWRIDLVKWEKEWEEMKRRDAERRRQWEIENAPRIARERFQKALAEYFVDNAHEMLGSLKNMIYAYRQKKRLWLHSRLPGRGRHRRAGVQSLHRESRFKFSGAATDQEHCQPRASDFGRAGLSIDT